MACVMAIIIGFNINKSNYNKLNRKKHNIKIKMGLTNSTNSKVTLD